MQSIPQSQAPRVVHRPTERQTAVSTVNFEAQGSLVKLTMRNHPSSLRRSKSGGRGKITTFSKKSRKRLLELGARLDMAGAALGKPIIFMTITYAQKWPEPEQVSRNFRALLERLRRFAPQSSAIWRIEYQKRGAPHFHLICFGLPYLDKALLAAWWGEIIGREFWDYSQGEQNPRVPFTRIEAIKSGRRAMFYLSKYVAKMPEPAPTAFCEDAVQGGNAVASGFINVPYLHAGRWWGIFNESFLPFAKLLQGSLKLSDTGTKQVFFNLRRLMAAVWPRANKSGTFNGASVFVDSSDKWFDYWLHLWLEHSL